MTSADVFYAIQSGTPKSLTADVMAAYVDDELWADASAATPAAAGDVFFMRRSGTSYSVDIDVLATYVNTTVQATVLDFSGLSADTPAASDVFVFDDGAAKKITLANLETQLWTDFNTYVSALTAVATSADSDKFYTIQGGSSKYVTMSEFWDYTEAKFQGLTAKTTPVAADILTIQDSAASYALKELTLANLEVVLWDDFETYVAALTQVVTPADSDIFYTIQGGTPKYATNAELWAYITTKIQALTAKTTPVAADILTIQDSADSSALKELTVGNLWDNEYSNKALATTAGTGITAAVASYVAGVERVGTFYKTTIVIDIAGLRSTAGGDIIGLDGTTNPCHIGQLTAAKNGTIFAGKIECLETPAGGDPDIDLYSATESTGAEDTAISTLTETQLLNAGDHAVNLFKSLTAFPAANEYLYLVAGDTTDADYTAGIFVIELWGK